MANVPISRSCGIYSEFSCGSFDAKIPQPKVIYRYFPNKPLKFYRHNVFRALIFMNIFDKFFELLIGSN
jgi:hypothetical protein